MNRYRFIGNKAEKKVAPKKTLSPKVEMTAADVVWLKRYLIKKNDKRIMKFLDKCEKGVVASVIVNANKEITGNKKFDSTLLRYLKTWDIEVEVDNE